jgi:hypothetical protein
MNNNQIFSTDSYEDILTTQSNPFKTIPFQKECTWNEGTEGVFDGNAIESFFTNTDKGISSGFSSVIGTEPYELVFGSGMVKPSTPVPEGKVRISLAIYGEGMGTATIEPYREDGIYDLNEDLSITFTATPNDGYEFTAWSMKGYPLDMLGETFSWDMGNFADEVFYEKTNDLTVYACFKDVSVKKQMCIAYAESTLGGDYVIPGSIKQVPDYPDKLYTIGTSVTMTAKENHGFVFMGWFNVGEGEYEPVSTDATYQTPPIEEDVNYVYIAGFMADPNYRFLVEHDYGIEGGKLTFTPNNDSNAYIVGQTVTISAVPEIGYTFDGIAIKSDEETGWVEYSESTVNYTIPAVEQEGDDQLIYVEASFIKENNNY